jgi:CrcB protein
VDDSESINPEAIHPEAIDLGRIDLGRTDLESTEPESTEPEAVAGGEAGLAARPGPTDPDVDLTIPAQRRELRRHPAAVLGAVSAGGVLGSCARYGSGRLWPTPPAAFPWTTLLINAVGCAAIGVLMVMIVEARPNAPAHPLARPFLVTGVLGGFTTFSTYSLDARRLVDGDRPGLGLLYLAATLLAALAAVTAGARLARLAAGR